jgi:hypothetical protein
MLLLQRSRSAIVLPLLLGLMLAMLFSGVAFAEEEADPEQGGTAQEHIGCVGNAFVERDGDWGGGMGCTTEKLSIQLVHVLQRSDDGVEDWDNVTHKLHSCTTVNVCNYETNTDLETGYHRVLGAHAAIPYPWTDETTIYAYPVSHVRWVP